MPRTPQKLNKNAEPQQMFSVDVAAVYGHTKKDTPLNAKGLKAFSSFGFVCL